MIALMRATSIYNAPPMSKKLIINAIEAREIRAAILEGKDPINFFVERSQRKFQKGNIYRARVTSIEPHLQAAFVELEKGQHGFLSASDLVLPDGGISLINGLPAPPMPEPPPEPVKEKKKEEPKEKAKSKSKGKGKEDEEKDIPVDPEVIEFEDTPEHPLDDKPKPPKTTICDHAGDWLLGGDDWSTPIAEENWPQEAESDEGGEPNPENPPASEPVAAEAQATAVIALGDSTSSEEEGKDAEPQDEEQDPPTLEEQSSAENEEPESQSQDSEAPNGDNQEEPNEYESAEGTDAEENEEDAPQEDDGDTKADEGAETAIFDLTALEDEIEDDDEEEVDEDDGEGEEESESPEGEAKAKKDPKNRRGKGGDRSKKKRRVFMKIEDVLEVGQYITVQITKEGIGNKAPMVSTYLSLAGHYMVLTPGGDRSGVSKQVKSTKERARLRKFIENSEIPERCGLIVRTAAEKIPEENLERDIQSLAETWSNLQHAFRRTKRSAPLMKEDTLSTRLVRDYYTQEIDEIWIDEQKTYEEIRTFFEKGMPDQANKVKFYDGDYPIFTKFKVERELSDLFRRRVNLPGGGSLIFDQGEAMLVIDINSGTFKEGDDDEDTAFRLNMLSCKEIARQVQMRDVGGIIMIDFVDMRRYSNRTKVEKELEKCFRGDKARLNVMSIGALGVLQMSRQRTKDSLRGSLYSTCPHCEGTGLVPSVTHSAMGILREIRSNLKRFHGGTLRLNTTAEMAMEIQNSYRSELFLMEKEEDLTIAIGIEEGLGHGEFVLVDKGPKRRKAKGYNETQEAESPSKKKRKRSKKSELREEDQGESMTSRLERLEKDFPAEEPLGIVKAPQGPAANTEDPSQDESSAEPKKKKGSSRWGKSRRQNSPEASGSDDAST